MATQTKRILAAWVPLTLLGGPVQGARAAVAPGGSQAETAAITPPRLSYSTGDVSFWRPGAQDWAPAQVNTPLAPGDELYTGDGATLELQVAAAPSVARR